MAVLHIVFMILKIIGILLLVLVGILLLGGTCCFILPCTIPGPGGYRDKEHYGGKAGVSWLFHLIFFTVWYDSGEDRAGYENPYFRDPGPETFKGPEAAKKDRRKERKAEKMPFLSGQELMKEKNGKERLGKKLGLKRRGIQSLLRSGNKKKNVRKDRKRKKGADPRKVRKESTPIFLRKFREIFQIPGKMIKALKNFWLTAGDICDKIKKIKKFLENEKFKRGMSLILQEGKKLLIHMLPGKIQGRIKFGTDDPCLTGEILGAAGIFYPLYGKNFSIEPCFDQTVLEGTVSPQRENVRHYGADLGGEDHPEPGCPLYYQAFQTIDGRLCQRWDCHKQREGGTSYGFRK